MRLPRYEQHDAGSGKQEPASARDNRGADHAWCSKNEGCTDDHADTELQVVFGGGIGKAQEEAPGQWRTGQRNCAESGEKYAGRGNESKGHDKNHKGVQAVVRKSEAYVDERVDRAAVRAMVNRAHDLRVLWIRFMSQGFFRLSVCEYAPAWCHNSRPQFAPAKFEPIASNYPGLLRPC